MNACIHIRASVFLSIRRLRRRLLARSVNNRAWLEVIPVGLFFLYCISDSRHYIGCLLLYILSGLFGFLLPVY